MKVKLSPFDDRMGSGRQQVGYEFPSMSTCTALTTTTRETLVSVSLLDKLELRAVTQITVH